MGLGTTIQSALYATLKFIFEICLNIRNMAQVGKEMVTCFSFGLYCQGFDSYLSSLVSQSLTGHFAVALFFISPQSHPNGFYWGTNAHGPSPKPTADLQYAATGSNQALSKA